MAVNKEDAEGVLKNEDEKNSQSLWNLLDYTHWKGEKSKKEIENQLKKKDQVGRIFLFRY